MALLVYKLGFGLYIGMPTFATAVEEDPSAIDLEIAVHFLDPDGNDVVVGPGVFAVEAVDAGLQLVPTDGGDPLLLGAAKDTHDVGIEVPMAMSFPGESSVRPGINFAPGLSER